jgi:hypothetical protein
MIKSVAVDGRDHTTVPLDVGAGRDVANAVVTFTNARPVLQGLVRRDSGSTNDGAVIAFPAEPDQWKDFGLSPARIRTTAVATDGRYRFENWTALPAGDYLLVALSDVQEDDWRVPGFLARAAAVATRVTVRWGERTQTDLRLVEVR